MRIPFRSVPSKLSGPTADGCEGDQMPKPPSLSGTRSSQSSLCSAALSSCLHDKVPTVLRTAVSSETAAPRVPAE